MRYCSLVVRARLLEEVIKDSPPAGVASRSLVVGIDREGLVVVVSPFAGGSKLLPLLAMLLLLRGVFWPATSVGACSGRFPFLPLKIAFAASSPEAYFDAISNNRFALGGGSLPNLHTRL